MSYIPHQVQPPVLIFLDGTEFEVLRVTPYSKNRMPYLELILSPFEWTMAMLKISEKELSTKHFAHGTLTRSYPRSRILQTSPNPEKPIWIGFCTFDGNRPDRGTKDLDAVLQIIERNESLEARIGVLEAEKKRLEKDNYELSVKTKEYFETIQSLTKPEKGILPVEMPMDTEVKTKIRSE